MKRYNVHGTVPVVVTITVEAENENEAIEIAARKFKGVHAYVGNGGLDKLIGVDGSNESIEVNGEPEFDDCMEYQLMKSSFDLERNNEKNT